jgi:hypothetical protein
MMQNKQSVINDFRQALCDYLGNMPTKLFDLEVIVDPFNQLRLLLESAPLDAASFGMATNHLANAKNYLMCGECGAGQFELRMVLRCLNDHLSDPPSSYSNSLGAVGIRQPIQIGGHSSICGTN